MQRLDHLRTDSSVTCGGSFSSPRIRGMPRFALLGLGKFLKMALPDLPHYNHCPSSISEDLAG